MKVAMFSSHCRPGGGTYTHLFYLCKYLSKIPDIDLHLITFEEDEAIKKFCSFHTLKKSKIKIVGKIFDTLNIKKKILEINPDVVHVQGLLPRYTILPLFWLKTKSPVICTIHGIFDKEKEYEDMPSLIKKVTSYLGKKSIENTPNIIAVCPQIRDIIGKMTRSRIYVIPNGMDFSDIPQEMEAYDLSRKHTIFYVGRLIKRKGVDILLKAVSIVKNSIPDVYLLIAGAGTEEKELKELVKKLNMEDNVEFLGYISDKEKYTYIKSADIFVLPTFWESFPIVVLEAMACGTSVIASDVAGIPYAIEDGKTGLLFECGNVKELAEKIITLLQNEELRKKMGEAGKERVEEEFTWDKIAEKTIKTYREIIKKDREME